MWQDEMKTFMFETEDSKFLINLRTKICIPVLEMKVEWQEAHLRKYFVSPCECNKIILKFE